MSKETKETKFQVELKGIKLPEDAAARIESEIRQTVMAELARLDLTNHEFRFSKLPAFWRGIPPIEIIERGVQE